MEQLEIKDNQPSSSRAARRHRAKERAAAEAVQSELSSTQTASINDASETVAAAPTVVTNPDELRKEARKLQKLLRSIESIEEEVTRGNVINDEQRAKLKRKATVTKELNAIMRKLPSENDS